MTKRYRIAFATGAAVLTAAMALVPVRGLSQTPSGDAANAKAAARAKQNAKIFDENARVLTLYDRAGKPAGTVGGRALYRAAALSPDGKSIAAIRQDLDAQNADLWVVDVSSGKATRITTSAQGERVLSMVWSPDGQQLAYVENRNGSEGIYRRAATGEGSEELLYRNPSVGLNLSDWSPDGSFLVFSKSDRSGGAMYQLAAGGAGEREPKEVFHGGAALSGARLSPDGQYLSYLSSGVAVVRSIEGPEDPRQISDGRANAIFWRRDGKALYYLGEDQTVMVVEIGGMRPLKPSRPKPLVRTPVVIADISRDGGRFLAVPPPSRDPQLQQITLYDRRGKIAAKVGEPGDYSDPIFSPDGKRLALMKNGENWVFDVSTGVGIPIANGDFLFEPVWTPDRKHLLYRAGAGDYSGVYLTSADGSGGHELLFQYASAGAGLAVSDISADGKFLACGSGGVLLVVPLTGSDPLQRKAIEFVREEYFVTGAKFSPDGKFIAYLSNEVDADRTEVFVQAFDPSTGLPGDGKWQVSKGGASGGLLQWRSDGKELLYRQFVEPGSDELAVMSVEINTVPAFKAAAPKMLFKLPGQQLTNSGNVSPDGQRIALAVNVPASLK